MRYSPLHKVAAVALSAVLVCGLLPATSFANVESANNNASEPSALVSAAAAASTEDDGAATGSTEPKDASESADASATEASTANDGDLLDVVQGSENSTSADTASSDVAVYASSGKDGTQSDGGYCGTTDDGADGKNISWSYDGAGTLTLSGTGATDFYNEYNTVWGFSAPVPDWYEYRSSITNIVIGEGITELDSAIFAHTSITSITLPSSLKKLGQLVFVGCSKLRSVQLNEGLEKIGSNPFSKTAISTLYIPSTVSSIDSTLFRSVDISKVTIAQANPYFVIEGNALYNADKTKLIRISNQLTGTLVLPSTVVEIEDSACESASNLTQVVFPEGLKRIGAGAFNLSGLTSVTIPDSVTEIGRSAFQSCYSMTFAHLGSGYKGSTDSLANSMFAFNRKLTTVELSEGLEVIDDRMFGGCTSLTTITIPSTVTIIEGDAFNSTGLTSVTLPDGLEEIGDNAFNNTDITAVNIPDSVQTIGESAFPEGTTVTGNVVQMPDGSYASLSTVVTVEYDVEYHEQDSRSMLSDINAFRTGSDAWYYDTSGNKVSVSGLSTLAYDKNLEKIAQMRAAEIAINFAHERPDGSSCFTATSNGVSSMGENIAAGYTSADAVFVGWREDDEDYYGQGHRRNMLDSDFTAVGIGHVQYQGVDYWVQEFGTLSETTSVSGSGSTYSAPYRITIPQDRFTNFPDSFDFPSNLGLETKGASVWFSYVLADGVKLSDTWPSTFRARVYPYMKATDPSQLEIADGKITALVDAPTANVIASIGKTKYTIAASSYSLNYEVGKMSFAQDKTMVRYNSKVPQGKVPTLFGQPLVKLSQGGWATLVTASQASSIEDSSFSYADASSSDPVAPQQGDVNDNGRLNIVDAQLAYDLANGRYSDYSILSLGEWLSADMNDDATVDATDAFAIQYQALRA